MTTTDLLEHIDFIKKYAQPNNFCDLGFLQFEEVALIEAGLNLLRRQEKRVEANKHHIFSGKGSLSGGQTYH